MLRNDSLLSTDAFNVLNRLSTSKDSFERQQPMRAATERIPKPQIIFVALRRVILNF